MARVERDDVLLQMLLGQSAYQARKNGIAINAFQRVCKIAPGSPDCTQARDAILQLRTQAISGAPSG